MQFLRPRSKVQGARCKTSRVSGSGFTLMELIMVIVLLGIIGAIGGGAISTFFQGFSDSDVRQELFEEGKLAMMRLERDLHHMVPNGLELTSTGEIRFGTIAEETLGNAGLTGHFSFPTGNQQFILDNAADSALAVGQIISIYNTSWADLTGASRRVYQVDNVSGGNNHMRLHTAVLATSAQLRYFPLDQAVRYQYTGGQLWRSETPLSHNANVISNLTSATAYPLLANITSLTFSYAAASQASNSNGLISVDFTLQRLGTSIDFHKEIQVRNVP